MRNTVWKWVRWCGAVTIAGIVAPLNGCKDKPASQPATAPPEVEYVTIEQKDVPIYKEWVGTLDGDVNATISAQVSGYLTNRAYVEGSPVTNGQVLFQIDPAPFIATLSQAKAALAQANAIRGRTKLDVERYRPLAGTFAISQKELDNAVQADLSAQAQVEGAAAAVQQAQQNLDFTTIRSPIDGIAGLAKAQVGDLVGPGTGPLTTVTKHKPIRVYFSVAEQMVQQALARRAARGDVSVQPEGAPLQLTLAGGEVFSETGRIRYSDNKVDLKTGTVEVVGEFPNESGTLIPGMFARVRALIGVETNALLVPQRAVTEMQGRYLVAQIGADSKVTVRPVLATERIASDWIIRSKDLKAGDRVVAEGVQKIRDGMLVNAQPLGTASRAAGESPAPAPEAKKK
jgi:membrane fusion protein (multidrug efflux system)